MSNQPFPGLKTKKYRFRTTLSVLVFVCASLSVIKNPLKNFFQPVAVIVPHHNVVSDIRADFLAKISKLRSQTSTIVILSPDHFSPDKNKLFYSDRDWQLLSGQLQFDSRLGGDIVGSAYLNPVLVGQDHGITNLLSDVKTNFPDSRVVPILIGENLPQGELDGLLASLIKHCLVDCLLIASVDFSHYLPADLADVHDLFSQKILSRLESASYRDLEVDSPKSLYLLMAFAGARKAHTFSVFAHTNSGHISSSPDSESTSHFFASYSRTLSRPQSLNYQTFSVATDLIRNRSQSGVGDRFFYGIDYSNPQLTKTYQTDSRISITPARTSEIINTDGRLEIKLGPDLAVSGVISPVLSRILLLPLDSSSSAFLRSQAKTAALKKLLSNTSLDPGSAIIDVY